MPSAVGYQPTLATEMGAMQERITSTKSGSITSVQAVYVPADDLTDPAPATTFAHLDATTVLSRKIAELGYLSCGGSIGFYFQDPDAAVSSATNIITVPSGLKELYSAIRNYRILLPSWGWMNYLKKINWL